MFSVIRQELFKIHHQKSFFLYTLIIAITPLLFATVMSLITTRTLANNATAFMNNSGIFGPIITIFMIIEFAQIISSEFQFDTIKVQVAKGNSRTAIFFGKMITTFLILFFWVIVGLIFSIIVAGLFGYLGAEKHLISEIIQSQTPTILNILLLGGIVTLFSSILASNAFAITLGFVSWLAGQTINLLVMNYLYDGLHFVKYNPFNILTFLPLQFKSSAVEQLSRLSNLEMYSTWFIWTIILYAIAYISFKKRDL